MSHFQMDYSERKFLKFITFTFITQEMPQKFLSWQHFKNVSAANVFPLAIAQQHHACFNSDPA